MCARAPVANPMRVWCACVNKFWTRSFPSSICLAALFLLFWSFKLFFAIRWESFRTTAGHKTNIEMSLLFFSHSSSKVSHAHLWLNVNDCEWNKKSTGECSWNSGITRGFSNEKLNSYRWTQKKDPLCSFSPGLEILLGESTAQSVNTSAKLYSAKDISQSPRLRCTRPLLRIVSVTLTEVTAPLTVANVILNNNCILWTLTSNFALHKKPEDECRRWPS